MKKQSLSVFIILMIPFLLLNKHVCAQAIGGLSASKLGTLTAQEVGQGNIEMEPFFGYASTQHYFDHQGNVQKLFMSNDSTQKFSAFGFRFTYGVMKNMEIGVSLPVDVSEVRFGLKYQLPALGKLQWAILAGYNNIVGNQAYSRRNAFHESTPSVIGGLILSYPISRKWSIDFDAQYQKHTLNTVDGHTQGLYLNSDMGYYFLEKISFIVGLNYNCQTFSNIENSSELLTLNTGVAIERAQNFILVINAPFDIMGKNEYRTKGFGLALTVLLD
jgi:hypothetical protein